MILCGSFYLSLLDLEIYQLDVKTAFFNGTLDEEIYMYQPEGFVDPLKPNHVCRLISLYGLVQASRVWNHLLDSKLTSLGMTRSKVDHCVYTHITPDLFLVAAFWVDDGLILSSSRATALRLIDLLARDVEVASKQADHFVGLNIDRDRQNKRLFLSFPSFIDKLLAKFGMADCHPVGVPADPQSHLSRQMSPTTADDVAYMLKVPFRPLTGSLIYAASAVRLDIAHAVNAVARFCENPGKAHWKALKRILKYLKATGDHCLCFSGSGPNPNVLTGFSDADYAGDVDTRRSTTGYVFTLNGAAVTWRSRRQSCVALSTTESEYVSMSESTKEAVWIRRLLKTLGVRQSDPTILLCDNHSAIRIVKNPELHEKTKHIEVRYHFIRDQQKKKEIAVDYICSEEQLADIFTKPLAATRHSKLKAALGIVQVPNSFTRA